MKSLCLVCSLYLLHTLHSKYWTSLKTIDTFVLIGLTQYRVQYTSNPVDDTFTGKKKLVWNERKIQILHKGKPSQPSSF